MYNKVIVCTFLLMCLISSSLATGMKNETDDIQRGSKNFYVGNDRANFFQAFLNCKTSGMNLASINTERDQKALENSLKDVNMAGGLWLSGTNLANPGSFQYSWLTGGKRVLYASWLPGEPNNFEGKENCPQININKDKTLGWNDADCTLNLRYICQDV